MLQKILLNKSDILKIIFKILLISALCISTVLILLFLLALIIIKTDFSYNTLFPVTSAILAVSGLFSGITVSKWFKENGLIYGVFAGLIISVFIFGVSIICKTFNITPILFTKFLIIIVSGAAGGIIGVNTN